MLLGVHCQEGQERVKQGGQLAGRGGVGCEDGAQLLLGLGKRGLINSWWFAVIRVCLSHATSQPAS